MRTHIISTIAIGLVLGSMVVPVTAQTGSQIELQQKFLSSLKYSYGDNAPQSVYTFSGLNFKPHFRDVLGQNPAALQEANKAHLYNGIGGIGVLTMVAGSALGLANALEDAKEVSNDRLPGNSFDTRPLALVLVGAVVSGVGFSLARKHLNRGVSIFNNNEGRVAQGPKGPNFQMSISPQLLDHRPGLSLNVRWP